MIFSSAVCEYNEAPLVDGFFTRFRLIFSIFFLFFHSCRRSHLIISGHHENGWRKAFRRERKTPSSEHQNLQINWHHLAFVFKSRAFSSNFGWIYSIFSSFSVVLAAVRLGSRSFQIKCAHGSMRIVVWRKIETLSCNQCELERPHDRNEIALTTQRSNSFAQSPHKKEKQRSRN